MKTPPQPPPKKPLISPPNPPAALTAAPQQLGKKKLPYTKPTVVLLVSSLDTHGKAGAGVESYTSEGGFNSGS